ncbi:VOC family protein [Paracoccus maritimus]|uniref:VOC family protein n=1 Tax=Paracoccus maritimus TaxID=2933292 RepID=UPI003CE485E8
MFLSSILLYVSSIEESAKFYSTFLTTPPRFVEDGPVIYAIDGFELILHREPEPVPVSLSGFRNAKFRGAGVIIHFSTPDVMLEYDKLVSAGVHISAPPTLTNFGRRQLYFYDPDGYNICIEQNLRK